MQLKIRAALPLALAATISLAACGSSHKNTTSTQASVSTPAAATTTATTTGSTASSVATFKASYTTEERAAQAAGTELVTLLRSAGASHLSNAQFATRADKIAKKLLPLVARLRALTPPANLRADLTTVTNQAQAQYRDLLGMVAGARAGSRTRFDAALNQLLKDNRVATTAGRRIESALGLSLIPKQTTTPPATSKKK
jgi:hypothetical protein